MPPWMQVLIAPSPLVLALQRDRTSPAFRLALAGPTGCAAMLVVIATRNLPIKIPG